MWGSALKYLFLDTTATNLVVAIVINGKITYMFNEKAESNMSVKLMPVIDEGLRMSEIRIKDIDKIFVTHGPGSFTGIRIGLTFAKTLAFTLNIPVIPISSLEVMASGNAGISLINARRGYVYAGGYNDSLECVYEDKYTLLDGVPRKYSFVSYDELPIDVSKPEIDILKVINKHKDEAGINPHALNPVYLKQTEAEENLNVKTNN